MSENQNKTKNDQKSKEQSHKEDSVIEEGCDDHDSIQNSLNYKKTDSLILETRKIFLENEEVQKTRLELRKLNQNPPDFSKIKLDSNLRKTSAFMRKLRNLLSSGGSSDVIGASQSTLTSSTLSQDSLIIEMQTLNLSRYIGEIIQALSLYSSNLKPSQLSLTASTSDILGIVRMCSLLQQRYEYEFSDELRQALLNDFQKIIAGSKSKKKKGKKNKSLVAEGLDSTVKSVSSNSTEVITDVNTCNSDNTNTESNQALLIASKQRISLRLLTELVFVGVFSEQNLIVDLINDIIKFDQGRDSQFICLSLINGQLHYAGEECLGQVSYRKRKYLNFSKMGIVASNHKCFSDKNREILLESVKQYFKVCERRLESIDKIYKTFQSENQKLLIENGELNDKRKRKLRQIIEAFQRLWNLLDSISELLDIKFEEKVEVLRHRSPLNDVDIDLDDIDLMMLKSISDGADTKTAMVYDWNNGEQKNEEIKNNDSNFDDDETRSFYEDLIDLKLTVPSALLESENNEAEGEEDVEKNKEDGEENLEIDDEGENSEEDEDKIKEEEELSTRSGFGLVLEELPQACSRFKIDEFARNFCSLYNTKKNRKHLFRFLSVRLRRNQVDLIPYYSRLIATFSKYFSSWGYEQRIVDYLNRQFTFLFKKKKQIDLEDRLKNITYISHLTMFQIFPSKTTLKFLKLCIQDFSRFSIIVACRLLEICGRQLYVNKLTQYRTKLLIEMLQKQNRNSFLDEYLSISIENACTQCCPPAESTQCRSPNFLPPQHAYVRYLLFEELNSDNVAHILRKLRCLDQSESSEKDKSVQKDENGEKNSNVQCSLKDFVRKTLFDVIEAKFSSLDLIASLASALDYQHDIAVQLVDDVLEIIRSDLEDNDFEQLQRRVAYVKFLGELYTFRLIDSQVIFDVLYLFITLDCRDNSDAKVVNDDKKNLDNTDNNASANNMQDLATSLPIDHIFRIRLVATLLHSCGEYFRSRKFRPRLIRFLIYFQRFVMIAASKQPLSVDIEFVLADLYDFLRFDAKKYSTIEQIDSYIEKFEQHSQSNKDENENTKDTLETQLCTNRSNLAYRHRDQLIEIGDQKNISVENESENADELEEDFEEDVENETQSPQNYADTVKSEDVLNSSNELNEDGYSSDGSNNNESSESDGESQVRTDKKKTEEDMEFERQLQATIEQSIEARKFEQHNTLQMKDAVSCSLVDLSSSTNRSSFAPAKFDRKNYVQFRFMTKKPNSSKPTAHQMQIPAESSIASSVQCDLEAQQQEHEHMKRLIVEGLERSEIEERDYRRIHRSNIQKQQDKNGDLDLYQINEDKSLSQKNRQFEKDRRQRQQKLAMLRQKQQSTQLQKQQKQLGINLPNFSFNKSSSSDSSSDKTNHNKSESEINKMTDANFALKQKDNQDNNVNNKNTNSARRNQNNVLHSQKQKSHGGSRQSQQYQRQSYRR